MRALLLLAALAPLGCKDSGDDTACNVVWFLDADGDGFGDESQTSFECQAPAGYVDDASDCDDSDPAVNPDAPEVCNTVDDDCDGEVDEEGLSTIYTDADGDGFGDDSTGVEGCDDGSGGVLVGGDCDDGDESIHPDAEELCDGVDNDCSGAVDDDATDALTWYSDADADGYGDAESTVLACSAPSGAVADDTDCDDSDASQYPGAPEVCNDGLVNDCDGSEADARAACALAEQIDLGEASAVLNGERRDDSAGSAVAGAGDVDGDGLDDLLVGARGQSELASAAGAAYVVRDPRGEADLADSLTRFLGEAANDRAGSAVASAGDALGDGAPAVIVGAVGESTSGSSAGAVYLISGTSRGSVSLSTAAQKWTGEAAGDQLGWALASAELTGDGVPDLIAGAPYAGGDDAGAVYVFSGADPGIDLSGGTSGVPILLRGGAANDNLGQAVAAGDLDGDGAADLLAGAHSADPNGSQSGAVTLIYDPLGDGTETSLEGPRNGDFAGYALATGDLDGDGRDDLVVGAPRSGNGDNGAVYVVLGQAAQLSSRVNLSTGADATYSGPTRDDLVGTGVGVVPDVDGDGDAELLVGGPGRDNEKGGAWLVLGGNLSGSQDLSAADSEMIGQAASDQTGAVVSGVGDIDGDGAGDLLIGAVGVDTGGDEAGAAYLVLGPGI
ncbi:MAG: FG-GAP repeat protein [Alphaproteobacteria bacterium]|nr:FG-GAP repeat protein [Alphaproteobacteria bacterium]